MAIFLKVKSPDNFLEKLKSLIDRGEIVDWEYDPDGDFTSRIAALSKQAWFHPYAIDGYCIFAIIGRKNIVMDIDTYAEYHGEMLKLLLFHFPNQFGNIYIKQPTENIYDTKNINYKL